LLKHNTTSRQERAQFGYIDKIGACYKLPNKKAFQSFIALEGFYPFD